MARSSAYYVVNVTFTDGTSEGFRCDQFPVPGGAFLVITEGRDSKTYIPSHRISRVWTGYRGGANDGTD